MLTPQQKKFSGDFLSPIKRRLYYLISLPMAFLAGITVTQLDEKKSTVTVPFRWFNKNPFNSMYFAVLSMAAEMSTGAYALLAIKGVDFSTALIIVDIKAEFVKRAQSKVVFTCLDFEKINSVTTQLKQAGDTATVTAKSVGIDVNGDEVAVFCFTWSFKRRD